MKTKLQQLKDNGKAPLWLDDRGFTILSNGYLKNNETPLDMYCRIAKSAASYLKDKSLEARFFNAMWANWICPASPILANMGSDKGLPISCNTISVGDSLDNILMKNHELGILSKYGAGVGIYLGNLRGRGSKVKGTGGTSDGVLAWGKVYDSTIHSTNQGHTRRGAAAVYLPIDHQDIEEFLQMRRPTGDLNKRCLNLHQGVCITDEFMNSLEAGNEKNRLLWQKILTERFETGEPYLFFSDNVHNQRPESYVKNGLNIESSNICTEIFLYSDPMHTFVCCLLSLNLVRWEEWKDTDTVELSVMLLDAVLSEYIEKASKIHGLESAVRSAEKGRAIGIGVLGWHSLLQSKMVAFDSFDAMMLNSLIFRTIKEKAEIATTEMAKVYGEPEWCNGLNRRHTHLTAVAPTVSNSAISGVGSAGIEPIPANIYVEKSAKGVFIHRNKELEKLLESKKQNTEEVWNQINKDSGSVQGLKCLSDQEKSVFSTAREISQFAIVRQAAQRQKWIDQGQSVNLFFGINSDPKYIHEVHMEAWRLGMKSLYYCRAESVLRADLASRAKDDCQACEA